MCAGRIQFHCVFLCVQLGVLVLIDFIIQATFVGDSPLQIVVATITSDADAYAREAIAAARRLGLRVEGDLRNEKINYKVREHSLAKVPVLLVVGKKEAAERTVSIRRLGGDEQRVAALDAALAALAQEAVPPDMKRLQKAA